MCNVGNWIEEIPKPRTRQEIANYLSEGLSKREMLNSQIERIIDFFEEYERSYFDVVIDGQIRTFCRECGGRISEAGAEYRCLNCGKILPLVSARPKL